MADIKNIGEREIFFGSLEYANITAIRNGHERKDASLTARRPNFFIATSDNLATKNKSLIN